MPNAIEPEGNHLDASNRRFLKMQLAMQANARILLSSIQQQFPPALKPHVDPKDVLQDVFFEAFRRIGEAPIEDQHKLLGWLKLLSRDRVIDLIRMQTSAKRGGSKAKQLDDLRGVEQMLEDLAIYSRTPSQSAMSHEVVSIVQSCLKALNPDYRTILQFRYIEGLSVKESATRMGRSEASILMLCQRSLKSLKEHLVDSGLVSHLGV